VETVRRKTRTPGAVLASQRFDAAIEDGIAERPARYPFGATFVGADLPGLGAILANKARAGRAVVLVYHDGEERVIEPRRPRAPQP
jgi:hypothetical protein